ncbi:uncharacterized protein DUF5050 [Lachnotalea glycerini]|nr:DUF5050 domain-containing protein [Lachnotalea glycerini]PXV95967.1 uncharacterized protein DUF5050 [Lachnotalea glycerini]
MKQKNKTSAVSLIVIFIIIAIITAITIIYQRNNKTVFNTGKVSGNTAGNLYNKGIFCEYNDKIYFSNSYDQGDLYVMNSDGTNIKKLYKDTVSYINAAGKYIYYARNNLNEDTIHAIFRENLFGVYRINIDGSKVLSLSNETCGAVSLGNNKIFYQHYEAETALTLNSVSIDGTQNTNLLKDAVNPANIVDGIMYYNNVTDNFNLCAMNIETGNINVIYTGSCWNPIYDNNYIYFMDIENDYSLARLNLSTLEKESLNTGRVDTYNLYGDYIFYQANDKTTPRLCKMNKNGTNTETIIDGNFSNINVTSQYVYFNQYGNEVPIYKVSTTGDINVTRFDEAAEAVENK